MSMRKILLLESLILISLLVGLIHLATNYLEGKLHQGTIHKFEFHDADSVSVGSPVRIMGITVGNVIKVAPKGDMAEITIKIKDESIKIPSSSSISVQFTGLAGSRSIEITPPDEIKEQTLNPLNVADYEETTHTEENNFKVVEPIRVSQVFDIQKEISLSILDLSTNILESFGTGDINKLRKNIVNTKDSTKKASETILGTQNVIKSAKSQKVEIVDAANNSLNEINGNFNSYMKLLSKADTFDNLALSGNYPGMLSTNFDFWMEKYIKEFSEKTYKFKNLANVHSKNINEQTKKLNKKFNKTNSSITIMDDTAKNINKHATKENLNSIKNNINELNKTIKNIQKHI